MIRTKFLTHTLQKPSEVVGYFALKITHWLMVISISVMFDYLRSGVGEDMSNGSSTR